MITIDAHSRDMVANIVEQGATDPSCFAWQSQLRSYWDRSVPAALGLAGESAVARAQPAGGWQAQQQMNVTPSH